MRNINVHYIEEINMIDTLPHRITQDQKYVAAESSTVFLASEPSRFLHRLWHIDPTEFSL